MKNYIVYLAINIGAKDRKDAWNIAKQIPNKKQLDAWVDRVHEEGE